MASIHGKKGVVDFTGLTFEITSFTVDANIEMVDTSVMSSVAMTSATHWKSYLPGFKDWTASVEGVMPAAGIGLTAVGTEAALSLDPTDGLDWAGTAICTGISMANNADDAGRVTLSFQGVAALTAS